MTEDNRTYIAIDLKSFFASVECVERGLDPLTTNLVVADVSRTEKTICLAVSPSLKAYGIGGRARLFEVVQRLREVNNERRYKSPFRRPLVTADVEQYNALLRYSFQVTEQELSETGWKDDEIKQSKFPVIERADVLGCFSGDDLVAQFASYPLDMNIYGAKYAVGFVTSVCTYPEYTGRGIMKRLMVQSLTRMKDAKRSFALLFLYETY